MSVLNENTIIGASAASDYEIEQSLRFNDDDGSYLSRIPGSASNRKTWTWSAWIKRGNLPASRIALFEAYSSSSEFTQFVFDSTYKLYLYTTSGGTDYSYETSSLFRDPSAWYHIVVKCNTTLSTQADRFIVYVNGERQANANQYGALPQNLDLHINATVSHKIGRVTDSNVYLDGYLGEINFIDGQALTPDSFGETGDYGEWLPTKYDGAYGTNGFYLPFKQDYSVEGFSTVIYEGTGVGQYVGGTGFKPDFIWGKSRGEARDHYLFDAVRGANNYLKSNTTGAAADHTQIQTSFDNDGFTVGTSTALNRDGYDHVAWCWDMGGTTASNTNGTINSSVRANTTYGQSIVSYTGNASSGATVGHGLSSAPTFVISKVRNQADYNWNVYHSGLGNAAKVLHLDLNEGATTETNKFNGTAPSSSVVTLGNHGTNVSGKTQILYCFHDVANYSKFSSFSGNGSTTGPVITLGFSPAFLMVKCSSATEPWTIVDNTRNPTNPRRSTLVANTTAAEADMSAGTGIDFTSTGFQVKTNIGNYNTSGQTYIYMAFADTREYAYWLDQSGNNNDWTSEGGLTESDVMVDSPTNNFATFNPLIKGGADALSEGNLKSVGTSSGKSYRPSTIGVNSGKFYFEGVITVGTAGAIGVCIEGGSLADSMGKDDFSWSYHTGGTARHNNSNASYGASYTTNDIIGVAVDIDNGTIVFFKNGASQGSYSIVGHSASYTYLFGAGDSTTGSVTGWVLNFGSDSSFAGSKTPQGNSDANGIGDFFYPVPSGFLALCTKSLPSVDVIPSENFNAVIYSGTGGDNRVLSGVGFTPDLGILKRRNGSGPSQFFDTVRGATKQLRSDSNVAESTQGNKQKTFTSDGYTLGTDAQINGSGGTYVAWNWKAGGSASSNSNGSITSQVSVNAAAGFSIVTYTGTGSNATVGHGLSKAPNMSWIKPRNFNDNWIVTYDAVDGSDDQAYLNTTNAGENPASQYTVSQNATTLGLTNWNNVNDANDTYVAYCFHNVDGYLKIGSYAGNNNADGTFVHLGFKAKFILIKEIVTGTGNGEWQIFDTARSTTNVVDDLIALSTTGAESVGNTYQMLDILSNGFKLRSAHGTSSQINHTTTYIYLAFAENPFKHTNAS